MNLTHTARADASTAAVALSAENLHTELATDSGLVQAVQALALTIKQGQTFALVGESGCGKSMTALSILRLLPDNGRVTQGRVDLHGTDLMQLPEARMRDLRGRRISMIFQEPATSLNPVLSVGDQILEVIQRHTALRGTAARERALQWLTRVGIPEPQRRINSYPFELSGGQKQRVMIAIALAAEPEVLIADEPTTALDVTIQQQILDLLRELQREQGLALLLITHDLGVVSTMAHWVALMYAGQIVEVAPRAQFFSQPAHPYARMLLAAVPAQTKRGQMLAAIAGQVPRLDQTFTRCRFAERCPAAFDQCWQVEPALLPVTAEHTARCWLYDKAYESALISQPTVDLIKQKAEQTTERAFEPQVVRAIRAIRAIRPASSAAHNRETNHTTADLNAVSADAVSTAAISTEAITSSKTRNGVTNRNAAEHGTTNRATDNATDSATDNQAIDNNATHATATALQFSNQAHPATPLLELRNYRLWFPIRTGLLRRVTGYVKAVDGVSLTLHAGRTLALVGESGCGKTTLGKGLLQLLRKSVRVEGEALLNGQSLTTMSATTLQAARRQAQIIFQDPFASLNPRLRVGDILEEGMLALRPELDAAARQAQLARLLDQVGLRRDSVARYPHEFSGGQRQRIAIARALAVEPQLIICDEPTSALDVSVQAQILNLLAQLQRELRIGYLFITHNFGVVEYLADEVAVMRAGVIVEAGPAAQLLNAPEHDYTQQLLAAVPRVTLA